MIAIVALMPHVSARASETSAQSVVSLKPTSADSGRFAIDPDGIQVGGNAVPGDRHKGQVGSVRLNCHPYGNYDAGACVSLVNSQNIREGSRVGIGSGLEQTVQNLSAYSDFENVLLAIDSDSPSARLVVSGVSYTSDRIYMPGCAPQQDQCRPLSQEQIAMPRDGMSVTTNSVDRHVTGIGAPGSAPVLPKKGLYAAFADSWDKDGKWIHIRPGWTVPGGGNASSGQIPSRDLDTNWTHFSTPTVIFGAESKDFGQITQMFYNPVRDASGIPIATLSYALEYEEVNMVNGAFKDYEASFHGLTLAYSAWHGAKPTADSYGLFITGGFGGGSLLRLTGDPGENEINSYDFHSYAPRPLSTKNGDAVEIGEFDGLADTNRERLAAWVSREGSGASGWRNSAMNLGLAVNGPFGDIALHRRWRLLSGTGTAILGELIC